MTQADNKLSMCVCVCVCGGGGGGVGGRSQKYDLMEIKDSKAHSTTIFQEMLILFKGHVHVVEKKQPGGNIIKAVAAIDDMQIIPLQASGRVMLLDSHVTTRIMQSCCHGHTVRATSCNP